MLVDFQGLKAIMTQFGLLILEQRGPFCGLLIAQSIEHGSLEEFHKLGYMCIATTDQKKAENAAAYFATLPKREWCVADQIKAIDGLHEAIEERKEAEWYPTRASRQMCPVCKTKAIQRRPVGPRRTGIEYQCLNLHTWMVFLQ